MILRVPQAPDAIEWDDAAFQAALERAGEGVIEARGVHLSADQLAQLLAAAPEDPEHPGQRRLLYADFGGATFNGAPARFHGATFSGDALFDGATFSGDALFDGASFSGDADFFKAIFSGYADFDGATFSGPARFHEAKFGGRAGFAAATFSGDALFFGAKFSGYAGFVEASFSGDASFVGATFSGDARFDGATFSGDAVFFGAEFGGDARFGGARFLEAREFGPVLVLGELGLRDAKFEQAVRVEFGAARASLARAVFRSGADVFVRCAELTLEDTEFGAPSLVAPLPAPGLLGFREELVEQLNERSVGFEPRVVSVRRAKVAPLTLSGVDLRPCRFAGAHGLDGLRLERVRFAASPRGWRRVGRWRRLRWTRRQTVAEEHHWRAEQADGTSWLGALGRSEDELGVYVLSVTHELASAEVSSASRARLGEHGRDVGIRGG